jgi:hypothetical protein
MKKIDFLFKFEATLTFIDIWMSDCLIFTKLLVTSLDPIGIAYQILSLYDKLFL